MVIYFCGIFVIFVLDKIKKKIIATTLSTSIRAIKYHPQWHRENDVYIDWLEWVLI